MTMPDSTLTEAFAAALRGAREAREHSYTVFTLLEDKIANNENPSHLIINLLDIFAEVCWVYTLYHRMMEPCVEICGVDLQALVAAAIAEKTNSHRTPTEAARVFGHMLRDVRATMGVSGDELAARAGLGIERYRQIDGGASEPNLDELRSIAAALDKQPSDLIMRFDRMRTSMILKSVSRDVLGNGQ